jgi:hyperosmotically inducible protein
MVAKMQPLTNPDLGQTVLRALEETAQLDLGGVSVRTDDGVVTVSGLVRSHVARDAVERAFEQVSGLRAIACDLEIKHLPERTDTEIAKGILRAFQSHAIMTADDVRVIVSNGLVRLDGSMRSQFERLLAEAAAKGVRGVQHIENNIEVKPQTGSTAAPLNKSAEGFREADIPNNADNGTDIWTETGSAEAG